MSYFLYKLNNKNRKCYVQINVGQYNNQYTEFRYDRNRATEFHVYNENDLQNLDRYMSDIESETKCKIYSELK